MIGKEVMTEAKTRDGETIIVSNSTMHYTGPRVSSLNGTMDDIDKLNAAKKFINDYMSSLNGTESIDDIIKDCMFSTEVLAWIGDLPKDNPIRRSKFWMMQLTVSTAIRSYTDRKIDYVAQNPCTPYSLLR